MKKCFLICLSFVTILCLNVKAQDFGTKGIIETGGVISFTSITDVSNGETADESTTLFALEPIIGYFVANGFEIGLMPIYVSQSFDDNSTSMFGIFLAPAYNFNTGGNVYPFIEGRIGYNTVNYDDGDDDQSLSGLSYGGRGGIKVQLGGNSLLNFGVEYMMITLDPEDWEGDRNGENILAISAGWTVFFR
jgi:hypothetical protein